MGRLDGFFKRYSVTSQASKSFLTDSGTANFSGMTRFIFELSGQDQLVRFTPQEDNLDTLDLGWKTSKDLASKAISHGLIKNHESLSLLGQVIGHLGVYRKITFRRQALGARIDRHADVKNVILDDVIQALEALKPLEQMINTYDVMQSKETNAVRLEIAFKQARIQIEALQKELDQQGSRPSDLLCEKDQSCLNKIKALLRDFLLYLAMREADSKVVLSWHVPKDIQARFSPMGLNSLGDFIHERISEILSVAQEVNQNLTTLRGDFNSCIEEARAALGHHEYHLHNPILPIHQGDFGQSEEEPVLLLASELGLTHSDDLIDFALMAAELTEKKYSPYQQSLIDEDSLVVSQAAKWKTRSGGPLTPESKLKINLVKDAVLSVITSVPNLIKGLVYGETSPVLTDWRSTPRYSKVTDFSTAAEVHSDYQAEATEGHQREKLIYKFKSLLAYLAYDTKPLGLGAGIALHYAFKNIFNSSWAGLKQGFVEFLEQTVLGVTSDCRHGYLENYLKEKAGLDNIDQVFKKTLSKVDSQNRATVNPVYVPPALAPSLSQQDFRQEPTLSIIRMKALKPYQPEGLLPALSHGLDSFYQLFDLNMFRKDTLITLAFFGAYGLCGLAAYSPSVIQDYLGSGRFVMGLINVSRSIGSAFANGAFSQAIAAGFTLAKVAAGVIEGVLHGTDSWIVKAGRALSRDFSRYAAYTTMAVGFGWLVAEKLSIPYLSKHLKEDAGTVPFLAYGFAGLKLAVLLAEAAFNQDKTEKIKLKPHSFYDVGIQVIKEIRQGSSLWNPGQEEASNQMLMAIAPKSLMDADLAPNTYRCRGTAEAIPEFTDIWKLDDERKYPGVQPYLKRLEILTKLRECQEILPNQPMSERRDIAELVRANFDAETAKYLCQIIYPVHHRALLSQAIHAVLIYPSAVIRAFLSPISGSMQPWRNLGVMLEKDLTANLTALWNIGSTLSSVFNRLLRVPADFLVNQVLARIEYGLFATHHMAHRAYGISQSLYAYQAALGQRFYAPIYALQKRQTSPDIAGVFDQAWRENTYMVLAIACQEDPNTKEALLGSQWAVIREIRTDHPRVIHMGSVKPISVRPAASKSYGTAGAEDLRGTAIRRDQQENQAEATALACFLACNTGMDSCVQAVGSGLSHVGDAISDCVQAIDCNL